MINDLYEAMVQKYPGKFLVYGAVSSPYVDQTIEEATSLLQKDEFIEIAISTLVQNKTSIGDA